MKSGVEGAAVAAVAWAITGPRVVEGGRTGALVSYKISDVDLLSGGSF
jgi:hypothetical protein